MQYYETCHVIFDDNIITRTTVCNCNNCWWSYMYYATMVTCQKVDSFSPSV